MKIRVPISSVFAILFFGLTSCTNLFSPPTKLYLDVSSYEESNTCEEGIQATLTILDDATIIKSPVLQIGETFSQTTSKTYDINTRIRVEAFCYELGKTGHILAEGNIRAAAKSATTRGVDVNRKNRDNTSLPFSDGCITKDVNQLYPEQDITILEITDPLPCVYIYSFSIKSE